MYTQPPRSRLVTLFFLFWPLLVQGQLVTPLTSTQESLTSANGWKRIGTAIGVTIEDSTAKLALLTTESKLEAANRKGLDHEQNNEWGQAIAQYKKAVDFLEKIRRTTRESSARERLMEDRLDVYIKLIRILLRQNYHEEAFSYVERSKARSFLDQLAEAGAEVRKGADPEILAEEMATYERLGTLRKNLRDQNITEQQAYDLVKQEQDLEGQIANIEKRLRFNNPRYAALKYPRPISLEEVQTKLLSKGEMLLEYLFGEGELYLFLVDKKSIHAVTIPVKNEQLAKKIEQLLEPFRPFNQSKERISGNRGTVLKTSGRPDFYLAHELYQQLLKPAEPYLESIETLLIVPDGILFHLPFEMLLIQPPDTGARPSKNRGRSYLVEKYALAYAPSASIFKSETFSPIQNKETRKNFLALAPFSQDASLTTAPVFRIMHERAAPFTLAGENRSMYLSDLPFSAQEVRQIGALFSSDQKHLLGKQATKQTVLKEAKDYRYVHLATHGLLDSDYPMHSGVIFYDDLLQTYEVFNLELRADLVALSACETGLGRLRRGEGMIGLSRAFMYAGAPSVLVSLWKVSDEATSFLMTGFYQNLISGLTKAQALRQAKLDLINRESSCLVSETANRSYENPFFWAPFVLLGSWQ